MALNMADIFEHAADAFPDRVALVCGDRQVTYAELEERANRLAHHLAGLGSRARRDHVGLYARNSIEALETLLAACKLRAVAVNINFRYVENELHYMFADSDLAALVHDRRLGADRGATVPAAPGLRGLVEIDDGSDAPGNPRATPYETALAAASPAARLRPAQPRRRVHHLHRRHDRLPEGRDVASRGHLAHARRRHRLRHRRTAAG